MLGLFLQGSTGGHMLLVEHSTCVEHGELVHNSEAHAHASEGHRHADFAAVHPTQSGDSEQAHEHCALSFDRRDALASVDTSPVYRPRVDLVRDLGLTDAFVAPFAARFRIAPKNSPPA
ncbi:MAG: hypothetical protein E4H00_00225 [Myxococcales bacterium]|nr:MAG: hypothetical protein E4H00_00225 [Myxococcales bacterium]